MYKNFQKTYRLMIIYKSIHIWLIMWLKYSRGIHKIFKNKRVQRYWDYKFVIQEFSSLLLVLGSSFIGFQKWIVMVTWILVRIRCYMSFSILFLLCFGLIIQLDMDYLLVHRDLNNHCEHVIFSKVLETLDRILKPDLE